MASYILIVRDARGANYLESRGANFKSRGKIYDTRGAILGPLGAGFFLTMLAPEAGQVENNHEFYFAYVKLD